MFDALVDSDVRWTPYTFADISARSPSGLSFLCLRDQEYWLTRKPLVYDIHVEEYVVHRILRQFGRYQDSPLPITHSVPSHAHRWTRQGQAARTLWAPKLLPYALQWAQAMDDVVDEHRPHCPEAFARYLAWHLPRTRTRVLRVPQEVTRPPPQFTDTYPVARDQNLGIATEILDALSAEVDNNLLNYLHMTPSQHESAWRKVKEYIARFQRAISCRGGHTDVYRPPRPVYPGSSSAGPSGVAYAGTSGTPAPTFSPAPTPGPCSYAPRPTAPRPQLQTLNLGAGSSSHGRRVENIEYTDRGWTDDDEGAQEHDRLSGDWVGSLFSSYPYPDEIGTSQLGGAPLPTQTSQEPFTTPVADDGGRPAHHVGPPDPLTAPHQSGSGCRATCEEGSGRGRTPQARTHLVARFSFMYVSDYVM
ncbi:unnamed protein product [Urochloa humidicola]